MRIDARFEDRILSALVASKSRAPEIIGDLHSVYRDGGGLCIETVTSRLQEARRHARHILDAIEEAERAIPLKTIILAGEPA